MFLFSFQFSHDLEDVIRLRSFIKSNLTHESYLLNSHALISFWFVTEFIFYVTFLSEEKLYYYYYYILVKVNSNLLNINRINLINKTHLTINIQSKIVWEVQKILMFKFLYSSLINQNLMYNKLQARKANIDDLI